MAVTTENDSADTSIDPEVKKLAVAVIVGVITVIFDTTIVAVGIHELGAELNASVSTIQWVSTGYLLALFVTLPLTGWAQSRLGSKRLWMLALSIFLLGSLLCALAWDAPSLIFFRVIQGLGGGIMMPLMSTILMQAAGGKNLGRLMATVSLPASLGPILGPVLGGVILNYLSWHWMFLVNLPIGAVGLYLAYKLMPADQPGRRIPLDILGLFLIAPGVVSVVFGLSQVGKQGGFGHASVLVPAFVGLGLVATFTVRAVRRPDTALINLHLFRYRSVAASAGLQFLTGIALFGGMFVLPLYWQELRGEDALGAGMLMIPQGVGALLSRTMAGRLTDSIGGRWVAVAGFIVMALATLPYAVADETTSTVWLMAALFVRGLGLGAVMIPLMTAAYIGLDHHEVPDASIVTRVGQQVGGSFGVAVLAVILANGVADSPGIGGLVHGFDTAFWWATGFTAFAALLALLLPNQRTGPTARA